MPTNQNQVVVICSKPFGVCLFKSGSGGGEVDGMTWAKFIHNMLPTLEKWVCLHNCAMAAAIGIVVHLFLFIKCIVPDLVGFDSQNIPLLGPA